MSETSADSQGKTSSNLKF